MRAATPKRAAELRQFSKAKPGFLAEHPWCERHLRLGVHIVAETIHHRAGRTGSGRLLDRRFWAASCDRCNDLAETETGQALREGWLLPFGSPERGGGSLFPALDVAS